MLSRITLSTFKACPSATGHVRGGGQWPNSEPTFIVVEESQLLLQLSDTDRTLGLHNYLYVLRQGVDHVFVHPMPQELKFRLKKDALGKIQLDAMLLESLKASSKICKFSTIEQPEIRMSSRWQMVNFTSWRSRFAEICLEQWKPRVAIIYSETNLCACWWLGMPGNLHLAQLADRYVIDKFFWTPDHQIMSRTTILHWAWILINIATLIHCWFIVTTNSKWTVLLGYRHHRRSPITLAYVINNSFFL